MYDPKVVVLCGLGEQKVRNRYTMPHSVMVSQIVLKTQRSTQEVRRSRNDTEVSHNGFLALIVVTCRSGGV